MNIRNAQRQDSAQIIKLLNTAYRTNLGWTHESDYVQGQRIQSHQLEQMLNAEQYQLFVCEAENKIVACIGLELNADYAEIGSFAVDPKLQNQGLGKKLLSHVENIVQTKHADLKLIMTVLNVRTELIEYYLRRGYRHTGITKDYPILADVGIPIVPLHLVVLEKY